MNSTGAYRLVLPLGLLLLALCSTVLGAMISTGAYRLVLPLGLLLLALCSTGLALSCYKCDGWSKDRCTSQQECASGQNACVMATLPDLGTSRYACINYGKCNLQGVKDEFQLTSTSLSVSCCQNNLCNKGLTGLPASGLILFLASALVILFL